MLQTDVFNLQVYQNLLVPETVITLSHEDIFLYFLKMSLNAYFISPPDINKRHGKHLNTFWSYDWQLWLAQTAPSQTPWHNTCPTRLCPSGVLPFKPSAPLALCRQRDQGTSGGTEWEDRPFRGSGREASEASWSGFEVNRWAEWCKGSRRKTKCCRRSGRKRLRNWRLLSRRKNKSDNSVAQVRHVAGKVSAPSAYDNNNDVKPVNIISRCHHSRFCLFVWFWLKREPRCFTTQHLVCVLLKCWFHIFSHQCFFFVTATLEEMGWVSVDTKGGRCWGQFVSKLLSVCISPSLLPITTRKKLYRVKNTSRKQLGTVSSSPLCVMMEKNYSCFVMLL